MNIAIFASAFYPSVGGVEELVRQLAHEYLHQGLRVIVVTNRWPRSLPHREVYEGIPVYRLALRVPEPPLPIRVKYWLTQPLVRVEMLRILARHKIDLIHVQCVSSNGHYALIAHDALGLPLVLTAQGERTMDAGDVYAKSSHLNTVLRRLLREAAHITACSRHTLDDLERYFGEPFGSRADVVYNGVRPEEFRAADPYAHPKPYLFAIGRMVPQKGFDVLIKAFFQAGVESHDLLIAGDGPERESLESLSRGCGLNGRIHFLGRADRETTAALFKGCSIFVLPSRQEPMGIVNLEAMAAGKAVIASCTGGVPELVVDNETGLLVPPADSGALAEAIRCLVSDEGLRMRLGRAGLDRSQQFTWPAIAASYVHIYKRVLDQKLLGRSACQ